MSLCFCSISKPFLERQFHARWRLKPEIKFAQLLNFEVDGKNLSSGPLFKAVHADGVGIIYPASLDAEREDTVHEVVNGVAGLDKEEDREARNEIQMKKNVEKSENVEENDVNSRFKVRNGREVFEEKAYIVGVARKGEETNGFGIEESLSELEQLADTAGLAVVGSTYQKLATPNSRTYIGSGKVAEIKSAIHAFDVETVIFDDELLPGLKIHERGMAIKKGLSGAGIHRSRNAGSRLPIVIVIFISFLVLSCFLLGRGLFTAFSTDQNKFLADSSRQDLNWRERMAVQHLQSLFSNEVIDVIKASTEDLGSLSAEFFRTNNLSASWRETASENHVTSAEFTALTSDAKQQYRGKQEVPSNETRSSVSETPILLARRRLREKRREHRVANLVKQDDEVIVKLENAAIEHSKSVDSAVLGKYSIWRKEYENENSNSIAPLMRDQMIMARVYISLARMKNKHDLANELQMRLTESQHSLGEATADSDLQHSAPEKMKAMGRVLSKARDQLFNCKLVTGKLRAMLQSADEHVRSLKKQSTFLSQLAAKTIPNGLHCLSMRLTIDYYLLPLKQRKFPRSENLESPNLYHYALFSDNVLAASVVVNSTIMNVKDPEKHVFHLVSDKLNFGAMNMWFLLNPPGKATIHVENVDDFKWLNSSYCPVLRQLESAAMKEYYFKAAHSASLSAGASNLKYRNPKYLSMLNHLRFYLPQIYPKLDKILFLDDDIVVQKDLTGLWAVDLHGKVNGAVETCGESFHRFDKYLNFSNPHISKIFDPNACGWAYGMNIFDLKEWKKKDITGIYHKWQNLNEDRLLWKLGTLPPGLITFYGLTHPLQKSWHVLGLGYNPSLDWSEIENAAVIHYNGNMKPWLELAMMKYRSYWTKYIKFDHPYMRNCKLSE